MEPMLVRPHHLLDIISSHGAGHEFKPSPYQHAVHTCAEIVLSDLDTPLEFVVGADFICAPCIHLGADGRCDDMVGSLDPPVSKQDYNDALDRRLLEFFGLREGDRMSFGEYLAVIRAHFEGLPEICAHPKESAEDRGRKLDAGLSKLGACKLP